MASSARLSLETAMMARCCALSWAAGFPAAAAGASDRRLAHPAPPVASDIARPCDELGTAGCPPDPGWKVDASSVGLEAFAVRREGSWARPQGCRGGTSGCGRDQAQERRPSCPDCPGTLLAHLADVNLEMLTDVVARRDEPGHRVFRVKKRATPSGVAASRTPPFVCRRPS